MAKTLNINQTKVTLQIYDTIGQERFQPKLEDIRRGCEICIFVCDITKESSFNSLDDWLSDFITGPNMIQKSFHFFYWKKELKVGAILDIKCFILRFLQNQVQMWKKPFKPSQEKL
uniref:Uncharacterized protein n=1 Tax=Acrobeloides nanus TaxID=290746 RepID=A0A914DZU7_9BILA